MKTTDNTPKPKGSQSIPEPEQGLFEQLGNILNPRHSDLMNFNFNYWSKNYKK